MASESRIQPSCSSISQATTNNSNGSHEISANVTPRKNKVRKLLHRIFGNLHAAPAIETTELKQYPINGCCVNNKRRTVLRKK
ncbi:unnamed protein product [Rotaria socialis]|uniref:Uncharacterized protein n=1 Tax=Rotaria socialis TaxID=392032 RepID=A0A820HYG1_9BILA|nr:unnamed protein product [Rotaria socialis]CAF3347357.1 unnamed protein product [Rotaria socialis]CAF4300535.1 unnamed protein product [Rotaria socialis]CAF4360237.1 unnamed protein product [Rotaria socialis]CAF4393288.1 unnamed protein product [Rotaria socialis]